MQELKQEGKIDRHSTIVKVLDKLQSQKMDDSVDLEALEKHEERGAFRFVDAFAHLESNHVLGAGFGMKDQRVQSLWSLVRSKVM